MPYFVIHEIPAGLSGLVIAGIFAAAQSTVSSSLNSIATCAVVDFILPLNPSISEKNKILLAKLATWLAGAIGTMIAIRFALSGPGDLYLLFNAILGLLGGPITGVFLLGISSRRIDSKAAWTGFIISVFIALYLGNPAGLLDKIPGYVQPKIFPFLFAPIVLMCCLVPGYLVALFNKVPEKDKSKGLTYHDLLDLSDIQ